MGGNNRKKIAARVPGLTQLKRGPACREKIRGGRGGLKGGIRRGGKGKKTEGGEGGVFG